MNTRLFLKQLPRIVLLRPVPISDVPGSGACYVEHEWKIEVIPGSKGHVKLVNLATDHFKNIEMAAIKNFDEDARANGVTGLLNLHRQVVLRDGELLLERLSPPPPRPTHGEFMDDTIVRVLRENGQQTTELLLLRVHLARSGLDQKECFRAIDRLASRGVVRVQGKHYYLSAADDGQRDERQLS